MFIYFIISALIVLLDQASKYLLTMRLEGTDPAPLIPGLVRLVYVENTGAAFSFLSDMRWVLVAVSAVVVAVLIFGLIRYKDKINWVGRLGLASILGGALSNLIDRAAFGYVPDFFEFEFVRFAVFNVADIFITVGAVVFCLWYLIKGSRQDGLREEFILGKSRKKQSAPPEGETDSTADGTEPEDDGDDDAR